MKILGIVGSTRNAEESGVNRLVGKVVQATGMDHEIIHLRGKTINGCIACLGCVKDNVCVVKDDMHGLRDKVLEADAYVIGAPNYYSGLNAVTHAFLERWYQFQHQIGDSLWGKLAVAVGVGGDTGKSPADDIEKFMLYGFIETTAKVTGQGAASCFPCGHGETCVVGVPRMLFGDDVRITEEIITRVTKQPDVLSPAEQAGKVLAARLSDGHDRGQVAARMREVIIAKSTEAT